ncbi:unnamed protein product (macronuclear) [Paramecium tetraurelia]|uniref:Transmembrane protein n=1 Tax=Paramecium tetraurelia TaxID=5888 RepID=A0CQA6_PARTE|nr:uncharacterized protein GSPATT00009321001 [Paramecium tetraurelia]CAK72973.1 unnamed protein product [Paramecium tetraurelia]|eukprot:XP_001440370.1 hypothetical protein (macronuclear) [Paramecium tetraurelia strain d4-2]
MYSLIFLVYIFLQVASHRQTSPTSRIIKEVINEEQYSTNVNSSFLIQFANYFDIIDISLSSLNQDNFIKVTKDDPQTSHLSHGCRPYDREILYKKLFHFIPLFDNETIETIQGNISSLYSSTQNIFIVRSDLKLIIMKLLYDQELQEIIDLQDVQHINLNSVLTKQSGTQQILDPVIKCYEYNIQFVYCYVLTQLGTIHFQYNQDENKILIVKKVTVELSSKVLDVYLENKNRMLLVLSQGEVQVFQSLLDGSLTLIQKLTPIQEANLLQVKTNENGTHIFILDQQYGIYIYQIDKSDGEITLSEQNIQIKGGRAFDISGNRMFILLETEDELPYVLELFYDLEKREHYLNKITSYEQEVYDLYVSEKLTILIGNDVHSIIENSIYHRFYEKESEKEQYFNQVDLIQVDSLNLPWGNQIKLGYPFESGLFSSMKLLYDETYMVSISGKEVNVFVLNSVSPWVLCMAENTTKEFYQLRLKAQKCPSMNYENENPFIICESSRNFSFQGLEIYFYEDNSKLFLAIILGVILTIIGLSIVLMFYKNRYQQLNIQEEYGSVEITQQQENELKTENLPTIV